MLYRTSESVECRRCVGIAYPSRRFHGSRSWKTWGQAAHQLAGVRRLLSRRYLRLARRGQLERLAAELEKEVCRGLETELSSSLQWIATTVGGALVGALPCDEFAI